MSCIIRSHKVSLVIRNLSTILQMLMNLTLLLYPLILIVILLIYSLAFQPHNNPTRRWEKRLIQQLGGTCD